MNKPVTRTWRSSSSPIVGDILALSSGEPVEILDFDESSKCCIVRRYHIRRNGIFVKVPAINFRPIDIQSSRRYCLNRLSLSFKFPRKFILRAFEMYDAECGSNYNIRLLVTIIMASMNKNAFQKTIDNLINAGHNNHHELARPHELCRLIPWDRKYGPLDVLRGIVNMDQKGPNMYCINFMQASVYTVAREFDDAQNFSYGALQVCIENDSSELICAVECVKLLCRAMHQTCALCHKKCKRYCSGCQHHWYCSRKHQKIHWNMNHRKRCDQTASIFKYLNM